MSGEKSAPGAKGLKQAQRMLKAASETDDWGLVLKACEVIEEWAEEYIDYRWNTQPLFEAPNIERMFERMAERERQRNSRLRLVEKIWNPGSNDDDYRN